MSGSNEDLEQEKKYKKHDLCTFLGMSPRNVFYAALSIPSFKSIARKPLSRTLLLSSVIIEEELMKDFPANKSEVRKMRTLNFCFHCLQRKGEASLGFYLITKEDCYDFKSQLDHCSSIDVKIKNELFLCLSMDCKFQNELFHCLNPLTNETLDPVPESSEVKISDSSPLFTDSTFKVNDLSADDFSFAQTHESLQAHYYRAANRDS